MGATDIVAETLVIFCNFPSRDRYLEAITCHPELGVRLLEAGGARPGDGGQPPQLPVGQLRKMGTCTIVCWNVGGNLTDASKPIAPST